MRVPHVSTLPAGASSVHSPHTLPPVLLESVRLEDAALELELLGLLPVVAEVAGSNSEAVIVLALSGTVKSGEMYDAIWTPALSLLLVVVAPDRCWSCCGNSDMADVALVALVMKGLTSAAGGMNGLASGGGRTLRATTRVRLLVVALLLGVMMMAVVGALGTAPLAPGCGALSVDAMDVQRPHVAAQKPPDAIHASLHLPQLACCAQL